MQKSSELSDTMTKRGHINNYGEAVFLLNMHLAAHRETISHTLLQPVLGVW